jgi:hypothetical protein
MIASIAVGGEETRLRSTSAGAEHTPSTIKGYIILPLGR